MAITPEKKDFMIQVWRYLLNKPNYTALLSSLAHPHAGSREVKQAWGACLNSDARIKKTGGMKSVLNLRPDIFSLSPASTGHPSVALAPGAVAFNPDDGLPDNVPHLELGITRALTGAMNMNMGAGTPAELQNGDADFEVDPQELARAEAALSTSGLNPDQVAAALDAAIQTAQHQAQQAHAELQRVATQEAQYQKKPKAPKPLSYRKKLGVNPWISNWGGGRYNDIIWTPQKQKYHEGEKRTEIRMIWALYECVKMRGSISVSQLGSDYEVGKLKKMEQFKGAKFLDILKQYESIYYLSEDRHGPVVRLTTDAEAYLPQLDEKLYAEMQPAPAEGIGEALAAQLNTMVLPDRILEPTTYRQRLQALRIEIVHCLFRRGGRCEVQHIGQDWQVGQVKDKVAQGKKLLDFVRAFPKQFAVEVNPGSTSGRDEIFVTLLDADSSDETIVDDLMLKTSQFPVWKGKGKSKGKHNMYRDLQMPSGASQLYGPHSGYVPYMGSAGRAGGDSFGGRRDDFDYRPRDYNNKRGSPPRDRDRRDSDRRGRSRSRYSRTSRSRR